MNSEKVITLRMPEENVQQLAALNKYFRYYNRSTFIRAATEFFLKYADRTMQLEIMAGYGQQWRGYDFQIKKNQL